MGLSHVNTFPQWSAGGSSASIAASGNRISDAFPISALTFQATVQFMASNIGTPAAGHTFDFYWRGTANDEYATGTQGTFLYQLNTNADNPAHSDPISLAMPQKGGRVYVVSNGGAASIAASVLEQRFT